MLHVSPPLDPPLAISEGLPPALVVSLMISDPPTDEEAAALRGFYQSTIGVDRERSAQFVPVVVTAAPMQVLVYELSVCVIHPEPS